MDYRDSSFEGREDMWDTYYRMATLDPEGLMAAVRDRALDELSLGRAAESLGSTVHTPEAMAVLMGLFNHSSPFVRACVVYSLADFMDEGVARCAVSRALEVDLDPIVKTAAKEVLFWVKRGRNEPFVPSLLDTPSV